MRISLSTRNQPDSIKAPLLASHRGSKQSNKSLLQILRTLLFDRSQNAELEGERERENTSGTVSMLNGTEMSQKVIGRVIYERIQKGSF